MQIQSMNKNELVISNWLELMSDTTKNEKWERIEWIEMNRKHNLIQLEFIYIFLLQLNSFSFLLLRNGNSIIHDICTVTQNFLWFVLHFFMYLLL